MEINFRRLLFQVGERECKMNNKNLNFKKKKKKKKNNCATPAKEETSMEKKELNSKGKKKKNAAPQSRRAERKKECFYLRYWLVARPSCEGPPGKEKHQLIQDEDENRLAKMMELKQQGV